MSGRIVRAPAAFAPQVDGPRPLFTIMGRDGLRVLDQIAILAWFLAIAFYTPLRPLILYSCCAFFTASLFLHARTFGPILLRCWPMFIIPVLAFISCLWAPSVSDAIRKSMLFFMTAVVAIFYAGRLSARQILYTIFVVQWLAGVASSVRPDYVGDAATGIYDQKNMLAINMFYLLGPSLLLLMDKEAPKALRIMALLGAPMSLYLIIISKSMTTLVLTILAVIGLLAHEAVWRPAQRVRHMRTLVTIILVVLGLLAAFVLFALVRADYFSLFLEALGKDPTLTGRTMMWETAKRIMEERPWTGMGAEGFWRPEVGAANSIMSLVHLETFVPLTFHNSYFENGAMYGYPGYYGTMFLAAWCVLQAVRNWLRHQTMFNIYFVLVAALTVLRSVGESDFATEFGAIMIFVAAARFGVPQPEAARVHTPPPNPGYVRPVRPHRARPTPPPTPAASDPA